jgi:alpha-beta hydrolase superfamily lysophospholipase
MVLRHAARLASVADSVTLTLRDARAAALEACIDSVTARTWPASGTGRCRTKDAERERARLARNAYLLDSLKAEHRERNRRLREALASDLAGELASDSATLDSTADANPLGDIAPPRVTPLPVDSSKARRRRTEGSTYLPLDTAAARPTPREPASVGNGLALTAELAALGVAGGAIDRDRGGYSEYWRWNQAQHGEHALTSVILCRATSDHAGPLWGLAAGLAAGGFWELGQSRDNGHGSAQDFGFDAGGCALGAAWSVGPRRVARASWRGLKHLVGR